MHSSYTVAEKIRSFVPNSRERISFLCSSDATYVSVLLACWLTGNVAVPLCSSHPESMLEYYITDSQSKLLISTEKYLEPIKNIASKSNLPFFFIDHDILSSPSTISQHQLLESDFFSSNSCLENERALIIYTSGTTGRPKGVVLNHGTLFSQTSAVLKMWNITEKDSILHSLPLHHIHGIMNALLCLLKAGGTVVMQQKFNTVEAWKHFLKMDNGPSVNLFFAVPTMYSKLVQMFEQVGMSENQARKQCLNSMRLMCSGSASLPVPVFNRWEDITGHRIVERFGMSEIGMALSTTLDGPRLAGTVGIPLPDVEVKLRKVNDESSVEVTDLVVGNHSEIKILSGNETSGELLVKGPNVFKEYWNKEKATEEAFAEDGWFQTGDTACFEDGAFKILGRSSVDIIKSGGYKISALEVESCLLRHPDIIECTVFGLPDDVWGERVSTLIIFKKGKEITDSELKAWCKQYVPPYTIPTIIKPVDEIPRNVLGKVNKKELRAKYSPSKK
ncbi:malonate--CoA ligase ACSF3, mitochondrial [Trichonephila inaurata madagascariensis]|uniref:Malonate--CoA ligase ACSF3, mitochondrial n=1 Tax=Trichonephila inaurata madagascariensis TaxID=2747483 RepID=A0A8X7C7S4_9ARAC|nr:malonate--CoA ligase ACSF3, mitochondrial [Trichonephila inaurata madagascariensis]